MQDYSLLIKSAIGKNTCLLSQSGIASCQNHWLCIITKVYISFEANHNLLRQCCVQKDQLHEVHCEKVPGLTTDCCRNLNPPSVLD